MINDLVKQGYNKVAKEYLRNRDKFASIKYLEQFRKAAKPGALVLDLGCGSGVPVDEYLVKMGFKVIGIDISEKQIELAKKNVVAKFEVKDMSELKENEYNVDAVVSFYAIFHTPRGQHDKLFRKIFSFLPQGGIILVTMGAGEWEGEEDNFHGAKMWWSHYGPEKNIEIIKNAGFEILLNEIDISEEEKHQVVLARKLGRKPAV